jgi:hypothetical protein
MQLLSGSDQIHMRQSGLITFRLAKPCQTGRRFDLGTTSIASILHSLRFLNRHEPGLTKLFSWYAGDAGQHCRDVAKVARSLRRKGTS